MQPLHTYWVCIHLNIPIFAGGAGLCGGPPVVVLIEGATPFYFAA